MREHTRHRLAFDSYLRMGASRSLEALCQALRADPSLIGLSRAPSPSSLDRWCSTFHWQDRLVDLERQARERDGEAQVNALREMDERHRKEGLALQQKSLERISTMPSSELTAADAIRGLIEGVKLERLASGAPTEHAQREGVTLHGHIELRNFTAEELRRLAELGERRSEGARAETS